MSFRYYFNTALPVPGDEIGSHTGSSAFHMPTLTWTVLS